MRSGIAVVCLAISTIAAADLTDPEILERKPVPYPLEAKKLAIEGDVDLRVWVNADGTAGDVVVLRSSGDESLDRAAVAGVKGWKYKPSRRDSGEAIGNTTVAKVHFQLTDEDMQLATPQAQFQRYAKIWVDYVNYRAQNDAICRQCEAAGFSPDRARAGIARNDAGLDEKLAALEIRMKQLYGPAGMNVDPDQHLQHAHAEARVQAEEWLARMSKGWSTAERADRCRATLQNMEAGIGRYRERPQYEILISF
jgi:TonB family protein